MSRKSTRTPRLSLPDLRQQVDEKERFLQELLKIIPGKENIDAAQHIISDIKKGREEYLCLNRTLSSKLSSIGSPTEALQIGEYRSYYFKECRQAIDIWNKIRLNIGAEEISNPDWISESSIRSSASSDERKSRASIKLKSPKLKQLLKNSRTN